MKRKGTLMFFNHIPVIFGIGLIFISSFAFAQFEDPAIFSGRITAYDSDLAIIHGTMRAAVGPLRSKLMVTADSGLSWKETLPAQDGSDVVAISFADKDRVFAAVEWALEGPGWAVRIFRSLDSGNSWTELPPIQKPDYLFTLDGFVMGKSVGILSLYGDSVTRPGTQDISYLTEDGGMSWREKKIQRQPSPVCCRPYVSRGRDGSLWRINSRDDGTIEVYKCNSVDLPWKLNLLSLK
jgi:hypothetical protein